MIRPPKKPLFMRVSGFAGYPLWKLGYPLLKLRYPLWKLTGYPLWKLTVYTLWKLCACIHTLEAYRVYILKDFICQLTLLA